MTCTEAQELANGSIKYKGPWFKMRLTWLCGRINKMIERRAENGKWFLKLELTKNILRKYWPLIRNMYEDAGYWIVDPWYSNDTYVIIEWDKRFSKLAKCKCGGKTKLYVNCDFGNSFFIECPKCKRTLEGVIGIDETLKDWVGDDDDG